MKKRTVKTNRFTGKPRKWMCRDHAEIDAKLEEAEMWHYFSKLAEAKGAVFAVEIVPIEILRRLIEQDRHVLRMLEKCLTAREPLTEAEKRYCQAEAIPIEEFIRRVHGL